jgi:Domain of unknown function (DUF5753)
LSDEDIKVRVETRRRRREQLLARKRPPVYEMLLDEPVLYRRHCADPVAADQFAFLADLAERGWLRIRLAVYEEAVPLPTIGSYHLLYFGHGGADDNAVMYRESLLTDEIVEDYHKIDKHRDIFDRLWAAAEDETTSAQRIGERVSLLRKSAS